MDEKIEIAPREPMKLIEDPEEGLFEKLQEEKNSSRLSNLHSTSIKNYYQCPKKFKLSRKHRVEMKSKALTDGLLLEGYTYGFKPEPGYSEFEIRGLKWNKADKSGKRALNARVGRQDAGVKPIIARADYFRQFFDPKHGEPFVSLEYDGGFRHGLLKGEADYIGDHWIDTGIIAEVYDDEICRKFGEFTPLMVKRRVMVDMKDTSDIYWIWGNLSKQTQVIQSILYPYMWYKMTGEILDFVYFICWNKSHNIFKQVYSVTTQKTFDEAEKLIDGIERDLLNRPDACYENCVKNEFRKHCEYIDYCAEGREVVAESGVIDIERLLPPEPGGNGKFRSDEEIDELFDDFEEE